jgi:hypothetical protein
MSLFNGDSGRKPQAEARRFVYGCLYRLLDNEDERTTGWFRMPDDADEFDRRRLYKALDAVRNEMSRKHKKLGR